MTTTLQGKVATIFLFTMPLVAQAVKAGTSARAGFDSRDLRAFLEILSLVALFRLRSDAHHLQFAQQRALGRYVSDEFAARSCRLHHRVLRPVAKRDDLCRWWRGSIVFLVKSASFCKPRRVARSVALRDSDDVAQRAVTLGHRPSFISITASGSLSMTINRTRAPPSGWRQFCSQSRN